MKKYNLNLFKKFHFLEIMKTCEINSIRIQISFKEYRLIFWEVGGGIIDNNSFYLIKIYRK